MFLSLDFLDFKFTDKQTINFSLFILFIAHVAFPDNKLDDFPFC